MPTGTKIAAIVLVVLLGAAGLYYAFATPTSAPKFDATKGSGTTSTDGAFNGASRPNSLPPAGAGANGETTAATPSTVPGLEALAERQRMLNAQNGNTAGGTTGGAGLGAGLATNSATTATGTTTGTGLGTSSLNNPNAPVGNTAPNGSASTGSAPFKNGNMGFRGGPGTATPASPSNSTSNSTSTAAPNGLASNSGSTGTSLPEAPGMKAGNSAGSTTTGSTATGSTTTGSTTTGTNSSTPSNTTANSSGGATNGTYIVKKGDTMQTIAKQVLGSAGKWETLAKANPTVDPTRMKIGTKLRVPNSPMAASTDLASASTTASASKTKSTPSNPTAATSGGMHTVVKGETLSSIARQHYGDSKFWKAIVKANPKINEKNLAVGTKLAIPPKSAIADADKVTRGEG